MSGKTRQVEIFQNDGSYYLAQENLQQQQRQMLQPDATIFSNIPTQQPQPLLLVVFGSFLYIPRTAHPQTLHHLCSHPRIRHQHSMRMTRSAQHQHTEAMPGIVALQIPAASAHHIKGACRTTMATWHVAVVQHTAVINVFLVITTAQVAQRTVSQHMSTKRWLCKETAHSRTTGIRGSLTKKQGQPRRANRPHL